MRLGFAAATGLVVAVTGVVAAPTSGAVAPTRAPIVCAAGHGGPIPAVHRLDDTTKVTAADRAAVPEVQASGRAMTFGQPLSQRQAAAPLLPARVRVPVYVHVIKGTHRKERKIAGPKRVRWMLRVLNRGFHGGESRANAPTRYTFVLRHIDYTRRDGWYHAYLFGPRNDRMRTKLHRGGKGALNVYLNGGGPQGQPVLGWSTFPWRQREHPRLDGVAVNWRAMPWGTLRRYHQGDTIIHEVGHWMGLFHTFQGGCTPPGDMVADTPYESEASYACNTHRDSCPDRPGLDPVHDFMDYSWDSCMNQFTPGQVARMDRAFAKYRW